jgi:hypothetical protein
MRKHFLHLSAFPCDHCKGPVISGSTAVRESEISKETDIRNLGRPICLSCGHQQDKATEPARVRHLLPIAWESRPLDDQNPTAAFLEELNRAELR